MKLFRKKIDGENLAEDNLKITFTVIFGTVISFIFIYILTTSMINFISLFKNMGNMKFLARFEMLKNHIIQLSSYIYPKDFKTLFVILGITCLLTLVMYKRLSTRYSKLAYGQKGDNRLSTAKEIRQQYVEIPESANVDSTPFSGYGGVPVSHRKKSYYIDTETVNSLIIGTSRSGKGETIIFPLIDNLSRAEKQSSMVFNDPKGELFSSSKDTLEKRGYEVQVLNILDPMQSMSYNPLDLIIDAWKNQDYQRAQTLTNSFSHQMLDNPDAGQNKWVYDGAKHMLNGLILGLVDYCNKNNQLEKVTLYNITQMLVELYIPLSSNTDKTYLDKFFDDMPAGHMAKAQYASASNASDKAKGSIIQTVIDSLQVFTIEDIAKMTSSNSFKLKSVGFPKFIAMKLDRKFYDKLIRIDFLDKEKNRVYTEVVKPNAQGILELNYNCKLDSGYSLKVSCNEPNYKLKLQFRIELPKNHDKYLKLFKDKSNDNEYLDWIKVHYSEKPIAVFMITPDYDQSKNMIATTFVDQLYTVLMENASKTRGKKCFTRVHFILDEFGNMPALTDLDTKLSVCLSRNVLFDLAVQSYSQLFSKYNENVGQIAKENCQNHIVIKTLDVDTLKEISERIGKRTVVSNSRTEKVMDISTSSNMSASEEYIIPTERLEALLEREMIVLKPLHRRDLKGNLVRPYPIFNTKELAMPYRYQILGDYFDTDIDINDIDISSLHKQLDLQKNAVNFKAIIEDIARKLTGNIKENSVNIEEKPKNNQQLVQEEKIILSQKEESQIYDILEHYIGEALYPDKIEEIIEKINKCQFDDVREILISIIQNPDFEIINKILLRKERENEI